MIPTFLVSREIRRHATVALGGDGGDELFGGYHRYPTQVRQDRLRRRIPRIARAALSTVAGRMLPEGVPGRGYLASLAGDTGTSIANVGRIFREDERATLGGAVRDLSATSLHAPERLRELAMQDRVSLIQRATAVDFSTYMVDDVLVKVDRASMLASLEVRAPLLDQHVIEFAFGRVADDLRATKRDRKVILRLLGKRLLPSALDLRRKQGFSIPIDNWLRGAWRPLLDEAIRGSSGALVSRTALKSYQALLDQGRTVGNRVFSLLFLQLWEHHYGITDVAQ
jgi:asparagine synthase (glutamine-hydrolysing)